MSIYPDNDYLLTALGAEAARLLTTSPQFVRRRKEKVTLLDDNTGRRQMSVDFELPSSSTPLLSWRGEWIYYAPLMFLQKGSDEPYDPAAPLSDPEPHFANFDFRDGRGRAISLPPRAWNAMVSTRMIERLARDAVERQGIAVDPALWHGIDRLLGDICASEQLRATALLAEVRDDTVRSPEERLLRVLDRRDSTLQRLLDACAISSVVMLPLEGSEQLSGILKLAYDEQVADLRGRRLRGLLSELGWFGLSFWWELPYVGAATYHFEIEAPAGLEIYDAGLVRVSGRALRDPRRPDYQSRLARSSGEATRVHLYVDKAARHGEGLAWVRLRIRRHEFIGGAVMASLLVAGVLWAAYLGRRAAQDAPTAAPALLLLFPSVVAAYAARPDPHRLTARMLRRARHLVGLSAALPFVAAGALAVAERKDGKVVDLGFAEMWLALAIAATVIAVLLSVARVLPMAQITVDRWTTRLGLDLGPVPSNHPEPLVTRWRRSDRGRRLAARWRRAGVAMRSTSARLRWIKRLRSARRRRN